MAKSVTIIFVLCFSYNLLVIGQYSSSLDLNSDDKIDHISVDKGEISYSFKLKINDTEIEGRFNDGALDKMEIIDINKWDNYKEIVLHTPGPSGDDEYMIYWYDGEDIILMNHLSRWPEFRGNGIIYVDNWEGFWRSRDKFVLDNETRELKIVKQFAYYVGQEIQIGQGFEIYRNKNLNQKVALLADSTTIELILCDKDGRDFFDYRFLIKSNSGLLGWCDLRTINNSKHIPMAD